jgi:hypothetical protein
MTRHEFTKDTRDLYTSLVLGLYDCPEMILPNADLISGLAAGTIDAIRQAFKEGLVVFMCPDLMEQLDGISAAEDEVEFRITHNGKTIGVVINSEVQW